MNTRAQGLKDALEAIAAARIGHEDALRFFRSAPRPSDAMPENELRDRERDLDSWFRSGVALAEGAVRRLLELDQEEGERR